VPGDRISLKIDGYDCHIGGLRKTILYLLKVIRVDYEIERRDSAGQAILLLNLQDTGKKKACQFLFLSPMRDTKPRQPEKTGVQYSKSFSLEGTV
jgi:hypothetical protein